MARYVEPPGTPVGGRVDRVPAVSVERGLILVGGRHGQARDDIDTLARRTGWPVLAEPASAVRDLAGAIAMADGILRNQSFADDHLPDVIVRLGRPAASKVLAQWTKRATDAGSLLLQVGGPGVIDPEHNVTAVVSIEDLLAAAPEPSASTSPWTESWASAEARR